MSTVRKSQLTPYTCEQMFNIVNDVTQYASFLPYCTESTVHHATEDEMKASIVVNAGGLTKSFTTHNLLQKNKMIEIRLVDGPFSQLEGFWRFDETQEGCKVSIDLAFEFTPRMLGLLVGPFFEQFTLKMLESFCKRAETLYANN